MRHLCTNKLNFFLDRQSSNLKKRSKSLKQNHLLSLLSHLLSLSPILLIQKRDYCSFTQGKNLLLPCREGNLNLTLNLKNNLV